MPIIEYFSAARFFEFDSWDYFFGKLFGETMGANLILRDEETLLTMFGKDAKVEVVQGIPGIYISERNWRKGLPVRKNRKKNVSSAFYHDSIRLANRSSNSWKNLEMASKSVR